MAMAQRGIHCLPECAQFAQQPVKHGLCLSWRHIIEGVGLLEQWRNLEIGQTECLASSHDVNSVASRSSAAFTGRSAFSGPAISAAIFGGIAAPASIS